jgi:DNA-binding transcriptional LysR family regulator
MKFRHLEYFVAAAEELNFTHAADRLNVSQPPFSKQIHDLEGELGIEFFGPKSHPHANKPEIPLSLLKEEPFIGLNRMYPNYGDWLLKACRRAGFKPRIVKEADGAASALAFVAAGFGVAMVSEPVQKIPASPSVPVADRGPF